MPLTAATSNRPTIAKRLRIDRVLIWAALALMGCGPAQAPPVQLRRELDDLSAKARTQSETANDAISASTFTVPDEINDFCGHCHTLPLPHSFPREVWYDEIHKGFEFYARSGRSDLQPPAPHRVVELYRRHAPESLSLAQPPPIDTNWHRRFRKESITWNDAVKVSPAISSLRWVEVALPTKVDTSHQPSVVGGYLVATDMRDGSINRLDVSPQNCQRRLLARVNHPARTHWADIDGDGHHDLLVADLGSFSPYDHTLGKLWWIKESSATAQANALAPKALGQEPAGYEAVTLAEGLGRIADLAVADFNGDQLNDLLIAEFGHRHGGGIHLLTAASEGTSTIDFQSAVRRTLDIRPGTVQLAVSDFNGDGRLDFAAVISQEFECVELFVNSGNKFERRRLASGSDLTFGSVGLEMADLDGDGDQDLLYVNGDTFDNNFANASHGIQWLENLDGLNWRVHRLIDLPGAYRAVAADLDGDGDLDIVAVANLPTIVYPETLKAQDPVSIVVLEQTERLQFTPRVLERGPARYPALEVADFNGDGKVDLAVGTQLFDTDPPDSPAAGLPHVTIWWQQ